MEKLVKKKRFFEKVNLYQAALDGINKWYHKGIKKIFTIKLFTL
jgi:hypothetical protein